MSGTKKHKVLFYGIKKKQALEKSTSQKRENSKNLKVIKKHFTN